MIPGNGVLCLEAENAQALEMAGQLGSSAAAPVRRIAGANGTASCTTDANAAEGWSAGTGSTRESPGVIFTAGIVPDGVTSVTVTVTGRGSVSLPVHENVYMAEIHGWPASVSFAGPSGPVTIGDGPDVIPRKGAELRKLGQARRP